MQKQIGNTSEIGVQIGHRIQKEIREKKADIINIFVALFLKKTYIEVLHIYTKYGIINL